MIRFGVWGCGAVARQVVQDMPLAGVVAHAVASRSVERARAFAAELGVANASQGLQSLLDDPAVDIVYIATPHDCHAADAMACLRAGKPVLVEKPFAVDAREAEAVAALARKLGLFCMEAMWSRFVPAVAQVRDRLHAGSIGPVRSITGEFGYPALFDPAHRLFDPRAGGGAMLDRGVYLVSLAQHWFGAPDRVHAIPREGGTGVDEDIVFVLGWQRSEVQVIGHFAASLRVQGSNTLTLTGEKGRLHLPAPFYRAHQLESTALAPAAAPRPSSGLKARLRSSPTVAHWRRRLGWFERSARADVLRCAFPGHGYQFELAEAARCVREGLTESPLMPLEDSVAVMRTLDALRRSFEATSRNA